MRIWDDAITERDKQVYQKSGYGEQRIGFGTKPALVIIDVTYGFTGNKSEPILESIEHFPGSCGEEGWAAIHQIASLLPLARQKHIPVIYSKQDKGRKPEGWLNWKSSRAKELDKTPETREIVREIAPVEGEIVIEKTRPSIFFGTPLPVMLNALGIDTLLISGCVTSGCIRASVIDAFSYGYRVAIIEECTFDRGQISHKINLFDMNAKYADVLPMAEVKEYLARF